MIHHIDRRNFLKLAGATGIALVAGTSCNSQKPSSKLRSDTLNSDQALQMLIEGNQRYVTAKFEHPDQTAERRTEIARDQHPFAVILGCSDSRVSPEIVFDQGLGDLFVIRVAGNVADDVALGSIEFAIEELHVPLIMVLGHERCGAVSAAVDAILKGDPVPGHIASLVQAIKPAVEKAKARSGDIVDNAVRANVQMVVEQLKSSSEILAKALAESKLKIVGARYDLDTGAVETIV